MSMGSGAYLATKSECEVYAAELNRERREIAEHPEEEREEMESYLQREREGARFSFEDILGEELRLDRDEAERGGKNKGD